MRRMWWNSQDFDIVCPHGLVEGQSGKWLLCPSNISKLVLSASPLALRYFMKAKPY